jgi:hypothetical protein
MFCAPGLAFDGTEGAGPRFHVLRSRNRLGSYQGQQVPFSSFELLDTFFTVPRAPCPVFIFCAPGLIFDGSEGAESRIHVLRSRTHFGQYRGCQVQFSCFAPDSFGAAPSASGLIFMFCAPGLILAISRVSGPVFVFCALALVFDGTEGIGSRFNVLQSRTRFRTYRGRQVSFASFALLDTI